MYENLILYSLIAFVLYQVIPREKTQEAMKQVEANFAEYKLEMMIGSKNVSK